MKNLNLTLRQKLWITISISIIMATIFSFILFYFLYEKLYIKNIQSSLEQQGLQLATEYEGGELSNSFAQKVEWYNNISEAEVFLVDNPKELSACLPFEIDYNTLISGDERQKLLQGEVVTKIGYEERFKRNIMGIVIPLVDENRLMGIIYMYFPLATIKEVFKESIPILIGSGLLFILITGFIGRRIITHLTNPLRQMERISYQISNGDFSEKINITTNDEIGSLGHAFNKMSEAVYAEDQRKKEFLSNVAHELRTPLSYIKGYSEAIKDGVISSNEDKEKYLSLIHRESSRMERLIRDLLELAKLEGKSYPLNVVPLVLSQVVDDTLDKFIPILNNADIELKKKLDYGLIVSGDEDRLEQVIHNLLDNAIRYTPRGGLISVTMQQKSANCILTIEDTGVGMSKEALDRIGERFYREDKARSRAQGGTGLGLSIVKSIIQLHNGTINFASEKNIGTKITITLPLYHEGQAN